MDFSWESLGLLVSNFWEPNWLKRVLRTPRALDLVRPDRSYVTFLNHFVEISIFVTMLWTWTLCNELHTVWKPIFCRAQIHKIRLDIILIGALKY